MNAEILRIIDANCNRCREGLRVVEDFCRFVLNDADLSASLKHVRHDFGGATADVAARAIAFRDTAGDVGTQISTTDERTRPNPASVAVASCKRVGEALRCVEENLKLIDPVAAGRVEQTRYAFYSVEQSLARRLRPLDLSTRRLCVLITESACAGPWLDAARQAIAGGADMLQLREKQLESGELLRRARTLVELCRSSRVVSIINDRPDVAMLSDADGVHVGQGDLSVADVRKIVGDKFVGQSTHTIEQARRAVADGADYIGIGPIFPSRTKPRDFVAGIEFAKQVGAEINVPAFAIAGITTDNVGQVLDAGISAIAVTASVVGTTDITAAAATFRRQLDRARDEPVS
jgi:thiamine-phosphate pyrophosphorylase